MTSSSSSPDRGLLPSMEGNGVSPRPAGQRLAQLLLDRTEHRLAVCMPALVVAHLAQLRRGEIPQTALDLGGRQLVVSGDREARADSGSPTGAIRLGERGIGDPHRTRAGAACRAPDLATGAACGRAAGTTGEQLLEIGEHVIGLLAPASYELRGELLGVIGRDAA